jgi:branched-chain amino acid transport system ATP-binding protein
VADTRTIPGAKLEVSGLRKSYSGVHAVRELSFTVEPGEILGLIGPNGSGKTTAIDCITGFTTPDAATVALDGVDVSGARPNRLAAKGLVRTFQQVRIFGTLPVKDNIVMGGFAPEVRLGGHKQHWAAVEARAEELIDEFGLRRVAGTKADNLSYGQRKLMEIAAALVCQPRILLLDEPVAAINPTLAEGIRQRILDMNAAGLSILLVEHNMELVTGICHRVVVLDHGEKIAEGAPLDVMKLDHVQEAYFGH